MFPNHLPYILHGASVGAIHYNMQKKFLGSYAKIISTPTFTNVTFD
jgi:hypothetical protein